ncbi:MAG: potassium/proton antiporter [Melioribacteraceae bacterium]|nr:potassium/proton antiporter [Melioribacteraceae bacterium]
MASIDILLLIGASLVIISILFAKLFHNIGMPTMLLFILVGILAGSEGLGGIYFDDASLAQSIGIIALVLILFSGGLDTAWNDSKKVSVPSLLLATVSVLLTAIIIGVFVMLVVDTSFIWGMLVGSIISSTDAAAVFSVLRKGNLELKGKLKPLLELESGSNDPMAVFLTIGTIELITIPDSTFLHIVFIFFIQIGLGLGLGYLGGKLMAYLINHLNFFYEGVYIVFALSIAFLIYSLTSVLGGSGFLAIYIAGIILGNVNFVYKRTLIRFFDGLSVLSQIAMFLTLGLLVFPSDLLPIIGVGLLLSGVLIFIARPISVFITLIPFKFNLREKVFTSWIGLRGAVPIILATFPLIAGVDGSLLIFDLVFFIVLTSALIQGWSINAVAKLLDLAKPLPKKIPIPLEYTSDPKADTELIEIIVPFNSKVAGKQIVDLDFPEDSRIVLIIREDKNIIPSGGTVLESGDVLLVLANKRNSNLLKETFES